MISVIHAPVDEFFAQPDDYPVHAGGRCMELDWDRVAKAFDEVSAQFEWGADVRICPERRYVELVIPPARTDHVAHTTLDFYGAVAGRIGIEEFMSIWVDFDVAR